MEVCGHADESQRSCVPFSLGESPSILLVAIGLGTTAAADGAQLCPTSSGTLT
ncbi:unnamed protein product, partial [Prorocentrum cordatum]